MNLNLQSYLSEQIGMVYLATFQDTDKTMERNIVIAHYDTFHERGIQTSSTVFTPICLKDNGFI
jgi:hypothetical protein